MDVINMFLAVVCFFLFLAGSKNIRIKNEKLLKCKASKAVYSSSFPEDSKWNKEEFKGTAETQPLTGGAVLMLHC